jgi:hypothetical protein
MFKTRPYPILFLVTALLSGGCDRLCKTTVNDVVMVQNLTGQDLNLTFCKGKVYGQQQVTISSQQNGDLVLGTRERSYVRGGPGATCDKNDGERSEMGVALTSQSFGTVKLCRLNDSGSQIAIVNHNQSCPQGSVEQTAPVDTCPINWSAP